MESNSLGNPSLPLVSIIAICHNHARYVLQTLDSIRNQTYENTELIIINNVKDDCEPLIRKWIGDHKVDCVFIQNESAQSLTKNCNLGISRSNGSLIKPISCDDVLLPDLIYLQVNMLNSDLGIKAGLCFTDMVLIDQNDKPLPGQPSYIKKLKQSFPYFTQSDSFDYRQLLSSTNPIPAPSVLYVKSAVLEVGGFNEAVDIEDYSMNLALFAHGFKFVFIDKVLVRYRVLEGSLSTVFRKDKFYQNYNMLKEYRHFLDTKNAHYRWKLWKGILLMPGFLGFLKELWQYFLITKDFNVFTYIKLLVRYSLGTAKKSTVTRI